MALLWLEGFEGFGTANDTYPRPNDIMSTKYPVINREVADLELRAGRVSGHALTSEGTDGYFQCPSLTTDDTVVIGIAWKVWVSASHTIVELRSGADRGVNVFYVGDSGQLAVFRDSTLLGITSDIRIPIGRWHYIELKVVTDNTNGSFELCVAGQSVLSASGIDTQPGANAYHDTFRCKGSGSIRPQWDDIYFLDSTGSSSNDFLGSVRVVSVDPDGDDTANWTTSTPSGTHYENVDDAICDFDTSYVEEATPTTTDLYDYEDLPTLGDIYGIQVNTVCRETDATTFSLITPIESGSTQYDDSGQVVGTTDWLTLVRVEDQDPDTSAAWTESGLNAAKIGVKVG